MGPARRASIVIGMRIGTAIAAGQWRLGVPFGSIWRATVRERDVATAGIPSVSQPYLVAIEAERESWYELTGLIRQLTPEECLETGYYRDPDWSVRDVAAHLGTWLAEADRQFQQMLAGTYTGHDDVDVDGLNAWLLDAMRDQPWDVVWIQANAARTMMCDNWRHLPAETDEASWWVAKSGAAHYAEHVPRLREWVRELVGRRSR